MADKREQVSEVVKAMETLTSLRDAERRLQASTGENAVVLTQVGEILALRSTTLEEVCFRFTS